MTKGEALVSALLVGLLLSWGLMAWGTQQEEVIIRMVAAQEQEDPHANQPDHCSNAKEADKAHKCDCKKDPGVDGSGCEIEDVKCKKYCKKNKCYCFHHNCDS